MVKKILIVDDEVAVLALLSATLGIDDRYSLLLASHGDDAVKVCRGEKVDLVLLDVMMPGTDGYEVCRLLRKDPSTTDIKVIMLTALTQDFDRQKAMEAGADAYFTKPFSPTAVLEKMEELLGISR